MKLASVEPHLFACIRHVQTFSWILFTGLPLFDLAEESEIQRQLGDINRRYNALDIKIDERDDELDTALALTERSKPVDELLDWVQVTEVELAQSVPQLDFANEDDLDNLMVEFDKIQVKCGVFLYLGWK